MSKNQEVYDIITKMILMITWQILNHLNLHQDLQIILKMRTLQMYK